MTDRTNEEPPAAVSEGAKQAGEIWQRWSWVERTVWTERMLTALEQGVKGGKWFSLMDKVTDPKTLWRGFEQVKANQGAAGVDRQSVEDFERQLMKNLKDLSEQLREGTFRPQPVRRVWIDKLGSREKRPLGIPTVRDRVVQAALRVVLEPKPGLPTDPNDPEAFIDIFTDVSGLFVINNESGWYEGWMIHDLRVPPVNAKPRPDGHAQFGTILPSDAAMLKAMGSGHNLVGVLFTTDGNAPHFPRAADHFPDVQTNLVSLYLSMGTWNSLQQSDAHAYWEFNYQGTNWIHPLYELPFTGGFPDQLNQPPHTFEDGEIGKLQTIVPGSGTLQSETLRIDSPGYSCEN